MTDLPTDTPAEKTTETSNGESSTGGSTSAETTKPPIDTQQKFRRTPMITETHALYRYSNLLNESQNNIINRLNFYLELFLTGSVILSSFLIITVEKDWFGGYLSDGDSTSQQQNLDLMNFLRVGKVVYKENPVYKVENTIRLMIIGTALAFFAQCFFDETLQASYSLFCILYNYASKLVNKLLGKRHKELTNKEICKKSVIIISNVQMTANMVGTIIIGVGVGYVQGVCDPMHHMTDNRIFSVLAREVQQSAVIGLLVGMLSYTFIWFARGHELKGNRLNTLENQLNFKALNFDDTEEVYASERRSFFPNVDYDEDEEKVSLIEIRK